MMPIGGKKEGESSGDESKKRAISPATDNNDSDSVDGGRRSRRKKTKVSSVCINRLMLYTQLASPVAVCIAIWDTYTRLAWLPNPNLDKI